MSPSNLTKTARVVAGLLTLLTVLTLLTAPLVAGTAPESRVVQGRASAYDATREVTLQGTVQEVVTARVIGSPVGVHLLVSGPQGTVDVHAGLSLTRETMKALQAGSPVQIVGAMTLLNGKQYLLARLLTVNGRTITLRAAGGVLLHQNGSRTMKSTGNSRVKTNGEVR
jgi:hypothetical protein